MFSKDLFADYLYVIKYGKMVSTGIAKKLLAMFIKYWRNIHIVIDTLLKIEPIFVTR